MMFLALLIAVASCSKLAAAQTCGAKSDIYCKLDDCEQRLNNLEARLGNHVEFFATGAVANDNKDIVFPTVDINNGGGYDATTGKFTAPVAGMYYIEASLSPAQEKEHRKIQCFVLVNEAKKLELFTDKYGATEVGSYPATVTMPVQLNVGDVVRVGLCSNKNTGIHNDKSSNFNGVLLYTTS